MTTRPLTFDICDSDDGQVFVRVRAAGNRAILLTSETYKTKRAARNAITRIIEAGRDMAYDVRDLTTKGKSDG